MKRLKIFAGPNGSGKSDLYHYLIGINLFHEYPYINADLFPINLCANGAIPASGR